MKAREPAVAYAVGSDPGAVFNMHDAKSNFSRLVDRAAAGEEIIIAKHGKPVARLMPLQPAGKMRRFGVADGLIEIPDDFDDPLPPGIWSFLNEDE